MITALKAYGQAFGFMRKHGLLNLLWIPFIVTLAVIWLGSSITSEATGFLFESVMAWINPDAWLPEWGGWLKDVIYWLLWLIMRIILYFIFAFAGGSIILLLMSPILPWISEKVAVKMGKPAAAFQLNQFLSDLLRAAVLAIRNGAIQLLLSIGCLLLGFIPFLGLAAPVLLFVINAYFYGYNFIDFNLERHRMSSRESQKFAWKHRATAIGSGAPFALWMLIPFIGPMTAGYTAILGTVATTMVLESGKFQSLEDRPNSLK